MFYMIYSLVALFQLKLMERKPTVAVMMITALLMQSVLERCATVMADI